VTRRIGRGLAVLAGGLALAHAYPPTDWDGLAWISLAPFLVVALGTRPRAAFAWGWLGGFAFFLGLLRWLNFTFRVYSTIPYPLTWGPTMLLAGYCALWFGAVTGAVAWAARRRGPGLALLAAPLLWVAAEWGRGHLMGGFPWGLLGYSQYLRLPVIQVAEIGGVYAVSLVVMAANAAVAACAVVAPRRALLALGGAAVIVGGTLAFGHARLARQPGGPEIPVAIMQPAIEQPLKWDERYTAMTLEVYFGLSGRLPPGQASLLVWPETAAPTILRRDPGLLAALARLSAAVQAPILVGSVDIVADGPPPRLRNTAFVVTERGLDGRYDKMHLVPFGEYVPLPGVIGFVREWAEFISEMEPGSRPIVFEGPPAPFGVVICYEGIFPELFREFVRGGARLMINMTNDAWFGRTSGPPQHLAMYALRAVEHRIAIARSANTGVSAFIAPTGRIGRRLELFDRGLIVEPVRLRTDDTFYTRHGDWLAYAALAASGATLSLAALGRERPRSPRERPRSPRRK
jgi:apolipoprotein N-acyltransferase